MAFFKREKECLFFCDLSPFPFPDPDLGYHSIMFYLNRKYCSLLILKIESTEKFENRFFIIHLLYNKITSYFSFSVHL